MPLVLFEDIVRLSLVRALQQGVEGEWRVDVERVVAVAVVAAPALQTQLGEDLLQHLPHPVAGLPWHPAS